jgi:hypothetical protein
MVHIKYSTLKRISQWYSVTVIMSLYPLRWYSVIDRNGNLIMVRNTHNNIVRWPDQVPQLLLIINGRNYIWIDACHYRTDLSQQTYGLTFNKLYNKLIIIDLYRYCQCLQCGLNIVENVRSISNSSTLYLFVMSKRIYKMMC